MLKDNYQNIIFDLGGVILTLNYQSTIDEFSDLVGKKFDDFFTQYQQLSFFDEFEKGNIDPVAFRQKLRENFNLNCTDDKIDHAWNAMLGYIPPERIDFLKELGGEKRIFLLSNTNEIHLKKFDEIIKEDNGIDNFSSIFENAYYSHLTGMRKPQPEIFEMVMRENNLIGSETLFIDDSAQHLEGAEKAGLNAILLEKDASIIKLLCG